MEGCARGMDRGGRAIAFGFFELVLCGSRDNDAFKNKVLSFKF
jgi:hypothetical protein